MVDYIPSKQYFQLRLSKKFAFLKDIHSLFYFALLLIAVGLGFFGYALLTEHFTTPYGGDFAQQAYQLYFDFYDDWWSFFKTGQFPYYDSNLFLGADNVEANTYYGLFSPFTFPILFFPRAWIPQIMSLISIARLVIGGLFFRMYLRYMGCSEKSARTFALAFAFTGWMAYYLWFNMYYEIITFMPLMLYGIEKVLKEKKIWALSLAFGLIGLSNYFFLLTGGIFGVIYAGFRYFQTIKTRDVKSNFIVIGLGVAGFALGIGISLFATLPAIKSSFGITRATTAKYWPTLKGYWDARDFDNFWKMFFNCWNSNAVGYPESYDYYYFSYSFPLASYFFPTVSDRFVNIVHYKYFENTGSSIFIYTPCILLFICSMYRSIKTKKISHFIAIFIVILCLFVPFFYFLCGSFTTAYGRWEIVVPMLALTYIAINYDHKDEMPRWVIIMAGAISFASMIGVYFLAEHVRNTFNNMEDLGYVFYVAIYEFVIVIVETGLFAWLWNKKCLTHLIRFFLAGEIIVVGTLVANMHGLQSYETSTGGGFNYVPTETKLIDSINSSDSSYFRIMNTRNYESNSNLPLLEGYNGMSTFHSFYNNEIDDFLRMSQVMQHDTSWSGVNFFKRANLDEFLGVKYYVTDDASMTTYYYSDGKLVDRKVYEPNVPLNYERIDTDNDGYRVYKNTLQIELGTTYDTVFYKGNNEENYYNTFYPNSNSTAFVLRNEEHYFKGAILNDEDVTEIKDTVLDLEYVKPTSPVSETTQVYLTSGKIYKNKEGLDLDREDPYRDIQDTNLINSKDLPSDNGYNYQILFTPKYGSTLPIGTKGGCYYINSPFRSTSGTDWGGTIYLIGERTNETTGLKEKYTITFDNSMDVSRSSGRAIRGFYSKDPVVGIIIRPKNLNQSSVSGLSNMTIMYEPYENVESRFKTAINNGLSNVKYANSCNFTFETNFEKDRFAVTQLTYTKGWKCYATDDNGVTKELKVYNSQGGFAGFIVPNGHHTYRLTYKTAGINLPTVISIASVITVIGVSVLTVVITKRKKETN